MSDDTPDATELEAWLEVASPLSPEAERCLRGNYHLLVRGNIKVTNPNAEDWAPSVWMELYQAGLITVLESRRITITQRGSAFLRRSEHRR